MSVRVWILDSSPDVQFFKINMNGHHLLILFLLITFTFFSIFMYTFSRNYINTAVNGHIQFIKSAHLPTLYEHRQPDKRIHEIKVISRIKLSMCWFHNFVICILFFHWKILKTQKESKLIHMQPICECKEVPAPRVLLLCPSVPADHCPSRPLPVFKHTQLWG